MSEPILISDDIFDVPTRGTVIAGKAGDGWATAKAGDPIELRSPNGSIYRTRIRELGPLGMMDRWRDFAYKGYGIMLADAFTWDQAPAGTQVWKVDDNAASPCAPANDGEPLRLPSLRSARRVSRVRGIGSLGIMTRLFLLCSLIVLSGCVHDISRDPRGRTDYVVGAVYCVKRPLILRKAALYDPTLYTARLDGVPVSPGTLVRVSRLLLERGSLGETTVWVKGEIMDGPLAPAPVELAYLSANRVDTNILGIVRTP